MADLDRPDQNNPACVRFSDEHTEPGLESNNNPAGLTNSNKNNNQISPNSNHVDGSNRTTSESLEQSVELEEALGYLATRKTWHFLIFLAIASFDIPFAFNLMIPVFLVAPNEGPQDPCFYCLGNERVSIDPYSNSTFITTTNRQSESTSGEKFIC